jgi:hypothetical protein
MTAVIGAPAPLRHPEPTAPQPVRAARVPRSAGRPAGPGLRPMWAERLTGDPLPPPGDPEPVGHAFADMCAELLDPIQASGPLELVVLAHVTPDLDPRDSVAGALAEPDLLVFAVSDQGRLAPFTALQVAAAWPDRSRAAVIVLDQAVVPYRDPDLSALDGRFDHAVALHPDRGFEPVRQWAGVTGDRVADVLGPALAAEHPDLVILGPALPPPDGWNWCRAPGDQLGTAVFAALGAVLDASTDTGERPARVTVVEYEPALGGLALVTWSAPARPARHLAPVPELPPDRTNRR